MLNIDYELVSEHHKNNCSILDVTNHFSISLETRYHKEIIFV